MFPVSEDMDIERDGDKMFLVTTTTSAWGIRCRAIRKNCVPTKDLLSFLTGRTRRNIVIGKYIGKVKPDNDLCLFKMSDFSSAISPMTIFNTSPVDRPVVRPLIFREEMRKTVQNMFQEFTNSLRDRFMGIDNIEVNVTINE